MSELRFTGLHDPGEIASFRSIDWTSEEAIAANFDAWHRGPHGIRGFVDDGSDMQTIYGLSRTPHA